MKSIYNEIYLSKTHQTQILRFQILGNPELIYTQKLCTLIVTTQNHQLMWGYLMNIACVPMKEDHCISHMFCVDPGLQTSYWDQHIAPYYQ